jgi:hypothetical protein
LGGAGASHPDALSGRRPVDLFGTCDNPHHGLPRRGRPLRDHLSDCRTMPASAPALRSHTSRRRSGFAGPSNLDGEEPFPWARDAGEAHSGCGILWVLPVASLSVESAWNAGRARLTRDVRRFAGGTPPAKRRSSRATGLGSLQHSQSCLRVATTPACYPRDSANGCPDQPAGTSVGHGFCRLGSPLD